jgi:2-polyprenyl-3-methyl-5-hydroxy-6-metoxy-1,4-benzoquinol methylase
MNWGQRSYEKELLDGSGNSFEEIRQNMIELNNINHWLGGHKITINGFRQIALKKQELHVCEIGCGGGDNLAVIYNWALKNGLSVKCTGIDINEDCISFAMQQFPQGIYFTGDYRKVLLPEMPDIVFSSLFCHHFSDDEIAEQLSWMHDHSKIGFFINDLHRYPLAYYSIKLLTRLFSKSRLVKHDAPLSVQRGFTRREWEHLFLRSGISSGRVQWKWAFRWLITFSKKAHEN